MLLGWWNKEIVNVRNLCHYNPRDIYLYTSEYMIIAIFRCEMFVWSVIEFIFGGDDFQRWEISEMKYYRKFVDFSYIMHNFAALYFLKIIN